MVFHVHVDRTDKRNIRSCEKTHTHTLTFSVAYPGLSALGGEEINELSPPSIPEVIVSRRSDANSSISS